MGSALDYSSITHQDLCAFLQNEQSGARSPFSDLGKATGDNTLTPLAFTSRPTIPCPEGTSNVITAMKEKGVKRVAAVTSIGAGDSEQQAPFFFKVNVGLLGFVVHTTTNTHRRALLRYRDTTVNPCWFHPVPSSVICCRLLLLSKLKLLLLMFCYVVFI